MTNILVYDVETTGLPAFKKPSKDPCQPHIVEIAALLTNERGGRIAMMSALISPPSVDPWSIPPKLVEIHGITDEMVRAGGVPIASALNLFLSMWLKAGVRVGHNEAFDARMVRIEMLRCEAQGYHHAADQWKEGPSFCTMHQSTKIVGATRKDGKPKTPSLAEASQFFTGKPFVAKHRAMGDVLACKAIYFALKERGVHTATHPPDPEKPQDEAPAAKPGTFDPSTLED